MNEKILREMFEGFLEQPSDTALKEFVGTLEKYAIPPCPECHSTKNIKFGMNPRRVKKEQQYKCKACGHIYTKASIKSRERRENYPFCPRCGGDVIRNGSWTWTRKDGSRMKRTKYRCKSCGFFFRLKKRWI